MIICPQCGNRADDKARFCDQCGAKLERPAAPPTPAAPPPPAAEAGKVICPQCGASNLPGTSFCEDCGAPLAAPEPVPTPAAEVTPPPASQAPAAQPAAPAPGEVVCPSCGAKASPDDMFCYVCGADLKRPSQAPAAVQPAPAPQPPTPQPTPPQPSAPPQPAPNVCPSCGAKYVEGAAFCEFCGAALTAQPVAPAPAPVAPTPAAPTPTPGPAVPRLVIVASGVEIPLPNKSVILVGREDPISGIFPDIDLTPHGGSEGGVSRRHLQITVQGSNYVIEDLKSTNRTLVNRQRLDPGVPRVLQDGDEISAGRVRMVFKIS